MLRVKLKKGIPSLYIRDVEGTLLMTAGLDYLIRETLYHRCIPMVDVLTNKWRILRKDKLRIYVPDGIGDIHWVFTKLASLMEQCGAQSVDLVIRELAARPRRSEDFVRGFPGINKVDFVRQVVQFPPEGFWVKYLDFDYCLDATPFLMNGGTIEDWIPSLNYDPQYLNSRYKATKFRTGTVVISLLDELANTNWGGNWTDGHWVKIIKAICSTGRTVSIVGLECDRRRAEIVMSQLPKEYIESIKDLIGQTSFDECIKIAAGSDLVLGLCSGLTILSGALGIPTVVGWPGAQSRSPLSEALWYAGIKSSNYIPISTDSGPKEVIQAIRKVWRKADNAS